MRSIIQFLLVPTFKLILSPTQKIHNTHVHLIANGSTQRGYINKEDAPSPTVATELIAITATIDAKQGRDVMTINVPNAFIQTDMEKI
jgi:hypothetical protein